METLIEMYPQLLAPKKLYSFIDIFPPRNILSALGQPILPNCGIYAWYFINNPPHIILSKELHYHDSYPLLYIGISPRIICNPTDTSKKHVRSRLKCHYEGNSSRSTLRLTLGCLLHDKLRIKLTLSNGRFTFGKNGEKELSNWMKENTRITFMETNDPRKFEKILIKNLTLPLNIEGNTNTELSEKLKTIRQEHKDRARKTIH